MYSVHKLLWDVRHDPSIAQRFVQDRDSILDGYGITDSQRVAVRTMDIKSLYDVGINPMLLYFCALQVGVERQDYYDRIRGKT